MAEKPERRMLLLLLLTVFLLAEVELISGTTDSRDGAVLQSLVQQWQDVPPSWRESNDPCGSPWEGVNCTGSRVTMIQLSSQNIKGRIDGDIGVLTELKTLDLSFNKGLTGSISPSIGDLKKLNILILAGCGFTGSIPAEIGNLAELSFLALNTNNFTGTIPPSLGKLSKLYWLDLADNQLRGSLPISTGTTPGLDWLLNAKHFHFNKNQLSGTISPKLFNSSMILIHVLLDGNQFIGDIPDTVADIKTLEVLRLDRNSLSGPVPSNLNNLTTLFELHLANNKLTGPVPDLTGMNSLNYVDLSNNSFDPSGAPRWFSTLESMNALVMENANLEGSVPQTLFSLPLIQEVLLKDNQFKDKLDLGNSTSQQLQLVDFQNNNISSATVSASYKEVLMLAGNPVCEVVLTDTNYCKLQQQSKKVYSTSLAKCGSKTCDNDLQLNPQSCECALPYQGTFTFRAPFFRDLTNETIFMELETELWTKLGLNPGSVSIRNPFFTTEAYLQLQADFFPPGDIYFDRTGVGLIGSQFSNQLFKPPSEFGPYLFQGDHYDFQDGNGNKSISMGMIVGIVVGCVILVIILVLVALYAIRQKKRAERAIELSKPFASWAPGGKDSGGVPQLKGARWFSYDELKKSTNNFLESNEIGSGGYGKVYRGMLSNGQVVAIKRAQQGSMQGGLEFKTEIELLSRVHHKNLVSLVGFCFEQGEQMLVYEFIPNGTLRDSLSGRSGIYLDWKRRLRITLGSARGLSYLHELANPPIIHRDIKSTNILLDENLTAKVADFGLSKLVQDTAKGHVSTQVKGTLGYLDPEYYMTQQLTDKSDVYSFGVVMLELITSKQPIEKGKYIVREVRTRLDRNDKQHCGLTELMDPIIRNEANLTGFGRYLELAMQCVEESAADRPTMSSMVKEIETMLHNDGLSTNSTSAASSATEFANATGSHPYNGVLPKKEVTDSDSFDYSGGYGLSVKIEPK